MFPSLFTCTTLALSILFAGPMALAKSTPTLDDLMKALPVRMEKVKVLPNGEGRDANIVSLIGELFSAASPLFATLVSKNPDVINENVQAFTKVYEVLDQVPFNHPAAVEARAAMQQALSALQDYHQASVNLNTSLGALQKNMASIEPTVLDRNRNNRLYAPAKSTFSVINTNASLLSKFNDWESNCLTSMVSAKLEIFTHGHTVKANLILARATAVCTQVPSDVNTQVIAKNANLLKQAVATLARNYRIVK